MSTRDIILEFINQNGGTATERGDMAFDAKFNNIDFVGVVDLDDDDACWIRTEGTFRNSSWYGGFHIVDPMWDSMLLFILNFLSRNPHHRGELLIQDNSTRISEYH